MNCFTELTENVRREDALARCQTITGDTAVTHSGNIVTQADLTAAQAYLKRYVITLSSPQYIIEEFGA